MPATTVEIPSPETNGHWEPPVTYSGQDVHWFPSGSRSDDFHRAVVLRDWGGGKLKLGLTSGRIARTYTDAVRHIDDPYFLTHPLAKSEDGAWDYTPAYKAQLGREQLLSEKLAAIESRLDSLGAKKK